MNAIAIILLIAGAVVFTVSFVIPERMEMPKEAGTLARDELKALVSQEVEGARGQVRDVAEETIEGALEKTERSLERLSNEKIMAVSEYSDTVLKEIHKNHEEVMFLYDMLNDKNTSLKNTVAQINKTVRQVTDVAQQVDTVTGSFRQSVQEAEALQSKLAAEVAAAKALPPVEMRARRNPAELQQPAAILQQPVSWQPPEMPQASEPPQPPVSWQQPEPPQPPASWQASEMPQQPESPQQPASWQQPEMPQPPETPQQLASWQQPEMPQQPEVPQPPASWQPPEMPQQPEPPQQPVSWQPPAIPQQPAPWQPPEVPQQPVSWQPPESPQQPVSWQPPEVLQREVPQAQAQIPQPQEPSRQAEYSPQPSVAGMNISFTQENESQFRNCNEKILELYRAGKSKVMIAKELGLGVGEVKLVIDLYNNL